VAMLFIIFDLEVLFIYPWAVQFKELFAEFGVPTHEFRAFNDIMLSYNLKYEFLGAINNYLQIAIKIK
jgi:NADH:ubiquinone oxidoreductase subunit 3 (subunit A)